VDLELAQYITEFGRGVLIAIPSGAVGGLKGSSLRGVESGMIAIRSIRYMRRHWRNVIVSQFMLTKILVGVWWGAKLLKSGAVRYLRYMQMLLLILFFEDVRFISERAVFVLAASVRVVEVQHPFESRGVATAAMDSVVVERRRDAILLESHA